MNIKTGQKQPKLLFLLCLKHKNEMVSQHSGEMNQIVQLAITVYHDFLKLLLLVIFKNVFIG